MNIIEIYCLQSIVVCREFFVDLAHLVVFSLLRIYIYPVQLVVLELAYIRGFASRALTLIHTCESSTRRGDILEHCKLFMIIFVFGVFL